MASLPHLSHLPSCDIDVDVELLIHFPDDLISDFEDPLDRKIADSRGVRQSAFSIFLQLSYQTFSSAYGSGLA